jgi:hypothetical protein
MPLRFVRGLAGNMRMPRQLGTLLGIWLILFGLLTRGGIEGRGPAILVVFVSEKIGNAGLIPFPFSCPFS